VQLARQRGREAIESLQVADIKDVDGSDPYDLLPLQLSWAMEFCRIPKREYEKCQPSQKPLSARNKVRRALYL